MQVRIILILVLFFAAGIGRQLSAQFWGAKQPRSIDTPIDLLKPGEFTWAPELSLQGPILVTVSLDEQRAYSYRNGILIGVATISSGKKGHETPTGVFHTLLKDANHRSSKYNNAAMPYTQKITQYGIALHAGGLPGYPSSHGCVHLPSEFARLLFNQAPLGMTVVVSRKVNTPQLVSHPSFLSPVNPTGQPANHERLADSEQFRLTPEKAAKGPVTMIISRADQRVVVSRTGVEIGRARVTIKDPADSIGTHVYMANAHSMEVEGSEIAEIQSLRWIAHPVIDAAYGYVHHQDPIRQLERIKLPDEFMKQLLPQLKEGATIVLTDAPILSSTTGKQLAVLSSQPGK